MASRAYQRGLPLSEGVHLRCGQGAFSGPEQAIQTHRYQRVSAATLVNDETVW